ncbi:MAG TPA: glutamyl-tRNA reductase [Chitinophagaceae bacterium]|nr:glutamyl-tRNA reductase [Chitinophagaceae bacterium]
MKGNDHSDIINFCIAGINYKKTDASIRGRFAINTDQYNALLDAAPALGLHEVFVLSTCNRTEIYGITENVQLLVQALCAQSAGDATTFNELAYIKKGPAAVEHLFNVAAGLDSQILGDYEIIGQIKQSVKLARAKGFIGATLDRMVSAVLQSSKAIKNQTALSGGTVSVSFAAVQYIKEKISNPSDKKILLLGTGKIGRNTCKNIVDYLGTQHITLINRTPEKAAHLAAELGLQHASLAQLPEQLAAADIILVATNAQEPTILAAQLEGHGAKLIIDLSIPYNVEAAAQQLPGITLVNVDDLSSLKDKTLQKRKAEIPKAKAIIAAHAAEFTEWYDMRRHVPVLKAVKDKLEQIHYCRLDTGAFASTPLINVSTEKPEARIQKIITSMAVKMRQQNQRGCQYIEAINDFMATGTN